MDLALPPPVSVLAKAQVWFTQERCASAAHASARTAARYAKQLEQLWALCALTDESPCLVASRSGSLSAFRLAAAVLRWQARLNVEQALHTAAGQRGKGVEDLARTLHMLHSLGHAPELLAAPLRRRAKRCDLYPAQWSEQLISQAPCTWQAALLILALTGCRPKELAHGVAFSIETAMTRAARAAPILRLAIRGAKCRSGVGQTQRSLGFTSDDPDPRVRRLIDCLRQNHVLGRDLWSHDTGVVRMADVSGLIRRLVQRLWPDHPCPPNAYAFRYAFRQQCAMRGMTRLEIAQAMGHQSTTSATCYGRDTASGQGWPALILTSSVRPRTRPVFPERLRTRARTPMLGQEPGAQLDLALAPQHAPMEVPSAQAQAWDR